MSIRLAVGVMSADAFEERRGAVLATWGRDALADSRVDFVFVTGDPRIRMPTRYGQRLYVPCADDYRRLPQKTRWFCLWALAHTNADWLFKCDDDTYVRVDRLLAAIESRCWLHPVAGCADGRGDHFHGGAGYVLTREAALAVAARQDAAKGLEDWKARDAIAASGLWFDHDPRFGFDFERPPTPVNDQITCHSVSPARMHLVHEAFTDSAAGTPRRIPRLLHRIG